MGETCHIQHFVDRDPGPGTRDFACGTLTYDGHKGTDFRLPTLARMEAGVAVLAAAPGVVLAVRDGMPDVPYSETDGAAVDGRECGNGLVIDHDQGWETQYCHMRAGTLAVQPGEQVARGQRLGEIGLSGRTQFPHLHLSLRRNGQVIDPFRPDDPASCGPAQDTGLWQDLLPYRPGALLDAGFAAGVPDFAEIRAGRVSQPGADSGALVLFGFAFGGQTGDEISLRIEMPGGGVLVDGSFALEKDQAQYFRATGKRLTAERWPPGSYLGQVTLRRGDTVLDRSDLTLRID